VNFILSTFIQILIYVLKTYSFVLIASAILRMVNADNSNPVVSFVHGISEPPARKVTKMFPKLLVRNGQQIIDLGPIVVLLAVGACLIALENALMYVR
jgi:uncharacterized protein YggT (Ycf19 family)